MTTLTGSYTVEDWNRTTKGWAFVPYPSKNNKESMTDTYAESSTHSSSFKPQDFEKDSEKAARRIKP